jgi:hypothetical protein
MHTVYRDSASDIIQSGRVFSPRVRNAGAFKNEEMQQSSYWLKISLLPAIIADVKTTFHLRPHQRY